MKFSSKQIPGKGRGKLLGFPTINLEIPRLALRNDAEVEFNLEEGIYAAWVSVDGKKYKGALHFGPIPTFNESEKSLEVFLIGAGLEFKMTGNGKMDIEVKDFIREIKKFDSEEQLISQMKDDVRVVQELLIN